MPKPRLPANVLELNGLVKNEPGRYADRLNCPKPDETIGEPPFGMPEHVRATWEELKGIIAEGVLTNMDRPAFEALCHLLTYCRMQGWMVRPDVYSQLRAYFALFGMTPSDRTRVRVPPKAPTNPYSTL